MATKRKTSSLWEFFTCVDDVKSMCKICKQVLSHRTSVTNLKRHLTSKHPTVEVPWRYSGLPKPIVRICYLYLYSAIIIFNLRLPVKLMLLMLKLLRAKMMLCQAMRRKDLYKFLDKIKPLSCQ